MAHALTRYREENNVSMEALARLSETSRQTIWRIENGEQTPSLRLIRRLVAATGGAVSANDFLPDHDEAAA